MSNNIVYYGADWCADCQMVKHFFADNDIEYEAHDVDNEPGAQEAMLKLSGGKNAIPTLVIDGQVFQEPSAAELKRILHMTTETESNQTSSNELLIIGAGPTALAAAVYTTREDIDTVLYEKGVIGGLAAVTDWVDNYPGFPDGISGLDIADGLTRQAERFGAKIELGEVLDISRSGDEVLVNTSDGEKRAKAVLIATGSDYKKLGIPGEEAYYARGVHYCATCDGAFYRDKKLAVVGGGNSAVQEALFLTKFASHIDLLVRSKLTASDVLIHELEKNDKITVHLATTTDEIIGNESNVTHVNVTENGTAQKVEVDGVFIFIGLKPNTAFLANSGVELDEIGFVKTDESLQTAVKGVYAAGDVRSGATMQIASAVGEGATAALQIRKYLESH